MVVACSFACGPEPVYSPRGVPVYGDASALPTEEHYTETLEATLAWLAEETDTPFSEVAWWYSKLGYVEFHDDVLPYYGTEGAWGTYREILRVIDVYLPKPECLPASTWGHELIHHFQVKWNLPLDHEDPALWNHPDGLVSRMRSYTYRQLCLPNVSAKSLLLITF